MHRLTPNPRLFRRLSATTPVANREAWDGTRRQETSLDSTAYRGTARGRVALDTNGASGQIGLTRGIASTQHSGAQRS